MSEYLGRAFCSAGLGEQEEKNKSVSKAKQFILFLLRLAGFQWPVRWAKPERMRLGRQL